MNVNDDGLIAEIDGLKQFGEFLGIGYVLVIAETGHLLHIGQIGASAKSGSVALQDDDTDVVTTIEPVEGLGQLAYQLGIQRVAHLGAVEVDPCHAFAQLYFYRGEFHFRSLRV